MSLYDRDRPDHEALRGRILTTWTPEKEAALQADFKRRGIGKYREDKKP